MILMTKLLKNNKLTKMSFISNMKVSCKCALTGALTLFSILPFMGGPMKPMLLISLMYGSMIGYSLGTVFDDTENAGGFIGDARMKALEVLKD